MGRLTDDMTRLCGEIVAFRGFRKSFVKDLTHSTAALMANFHRAHQDMARKTKAGRGSPEKNRGRHAPCLCRRHRRSAAGLVRQISRRDGPSYI